MLGRIEDARKLRRDVETAILKWNERSSFRIKGVKNLSRGDLDTIDLYCETIVRRGTYAGELMSPVGGVKDVLEKYSLFEPKQSMMF